jgi:hypothetical protein
LAVEHFYYCFCNTAWLFAYQPVRLFARIFKQPIKPIGVVSSAADEIFLQATEKN